MLKKLLSCLAAITILTSSAAMMSSAATPIFSDDFSSGTYSKWTNPTIANDPSAKDTECEGVAAMTNGVMTINNVPKGGSFFYIAAKDIKLKNFTITMKVKVNQFNDGWLGVSFRKDVNDRYNGCNNNMVTLRLQVDKSVASQGYRGYPGTPPANLTNAVDTSYKGDVSGYLNWRLDVKDSSYKSYVNDQLVGEWTYTKNANEGFISINACLFDGAVDDVVITDVQDGVVATTAGNTTATTKGNTATTTKNNGVTTSASSNVTTGTTSTVTGAESSTTASVSDSDFIKSIYKDVTIDQTFSTITLAKELTVKDMMISFKLSDRYAIQIVDASGVAVTDENTVVTDTMKLKVTKDGTDVKTYTLNLDYSGSDDSSSGTTGGNVKKSNTALIIILVTAGVVLVGGGVTAVLILKKKGLIFKK